ncbi:FtsW/RodA/SpoVE family cell cycle protein [Adlercreutzia muris]|uniref:FtsW/RodA/SpoVE family cell cycle protein n=1 Tax=Adlercreutzia muris TaxID=1796610 RepID=UPI003513EDA1
MARPSRQTAASSGPSSQGPRVLLLLCALALVLVGLVMVFSASMVKALEAGKPASDFFTDQLLFVIVGSVVAAVLWRVNYRTWVGPALWVIWAVAVVLILATAVMGTDNYGAKRWLYIGSVGVQPSEFCKIAFLLVAVRLLLDYRSGMVEFRASMVRVLIFLIVPIAIMYRTQSDLGTTVICAVGIIAVMWMGGVPRKVIAAVLAVCVVGGLIAIFGTGYRAGRLVFLDPWNDGKGGYGTGYNIIRSYYALSEGGLFGVGLGNSHEKFQYLFASESDFIFAVIGEELGLVGAMAVVLLFFGVLFAGLSIAERSDDEIGTMVAGGCTVMLVFQAFLNIACVIGVFPTTGKPLPFISAGGSSMLASFILLGLILSVSRPERGPSVYEQRRADLRLVRQERPEEGRSRPSRGAGRPDRPGRTGRSDRPSGSRSSDRSRRPAPSGTAPSPRSRSSRR